jgi:hypothetical protein
MRKKEIRVFGQNNNHRTKYSLRGAIFSSIVAAHRIRRVTVC